MTYAIRERVAYERCQAVANEAVAVASYLAGRQSLGRMAMGATAEQVQPDRYRHDVYGGARRQHQGSNPVTESPFQPTVGWHPSEWQFGIGVTPPKKRGAAMWRFILRLYVGPFTVFLRWRDLSWIDQDSWLYD